MDTEITDYKVEFGGSDAESIMDALAGAWMQPGTVTGWTRIRARFDRELASVESWKAAACIGYAMREFMRCRDSFVRDGYVQLTEPVIQLERKGKNSFTSTLFFDFDSSHSERSDPRTAALEAFEAAALYVVEGSPVYKTDRVGPRGTRLCEGIGPVSVSFSLYKPCDD